MLNRTTRSGLLVLATVALAYACDNTSPTPDPTNDAGKGGNDGPGSGNNPGDAVSGGNGMGGSSAASGGTPGAGNGGTAGAGGDEPVPVYEQDDPTLIPEESDFQRVPIPVSVHNAMQIDIDPVSYTHLTLPTILRV